MSDKINEKLLVYQAQSKQDTEAFGKLYDIYVRQIYRFVFFKVSSHEEAEDITSEVFLKTWHYINSNKETKVNSFSGLLYRLARNCIVDFYREKSKRSETDIKGEEEISDFGKWEENFNIQMEGKKTVDALKKLKEEYREIVALRYVEELSVAEIAEITDKGKIAVRVTLHRALKKLKELLEAI